MMPYPLNPDGTPYVPSPIPSADGPPSAQPIPVDAQPAPPTPVTGASLRAQVAGGPIPFDYSMPTRPVFEDPQNTPADNASDQWTRAVTSPGEALRRQLAPVNTLIANTGKHFKPGEEKSWAFPESANQVRARAAAEVAADHATEASPISTYASPAPAAPAAPAAPPATRGEDLRRAILGMGGGGGGGGKAFDPYERRDAAAAAALTREDELRDMRQDAGRFNADELGKESRAMDRYAGEARARGESQSAEAKGKEAAFSKEAEALSADRINPNHYKETRGTFQAGLDILGGIFGGLGAAKGGPNEYVQHLNTTIARDIAAQEANHAIKKDSLEAKRTAYGMMLDRFGNDRVAAAAAHTAELDKWKAMGDARAALDDNVKAQAEWAKAREELEGKRAEYADAARLAARKAAMGPDKLALLERALKIEKLGADVEHTRAETGKLDAEAANGGGSGKPSLVNLPGGVQAPALSSEHAGDYTQRMLGADKFDRAVSEMQAIQNKAVGGTVLSPTERARYEGLAAEAKTAYVQMNGFKRTPNETEFHALDKIVPPTAGVFSVSRSDVLGQARQMAQDARRDAAQANLKDPSAAAPPAAPAPPVTGAQLRSQVAGRPPGFEGVGP